MNKQKNVFKYIYKGNEYNLKEYFEYEYEEQIELYLIKFKNTLDFNHLFFECTSLTSFQSISNCYDFNITNMSSMFYGCSSLSSLPDISKWNTSNVYRCKFYVL